MTRQGVTVQRTLRTIPLAAVVAAALLSLTACGSSTVSAAAGGAPTGVLPSASALAGTSTCQDPEACALYGDASLPQDLAAQAADIDPDATVEPAAEEDIAPNAAAARTWPTMFCKAKPGMTRSQIRGLMGEPTYDYTSEKTSEGSDPQMSWEGYGYHFTAFFGLDAKVRTLQINDLELTEAEKDALPCDIRRP